MKNEDQWFLEGFYDYTSWGKIISSFKAFQDRRTLEKMTKTAKIAQELLSCAPAHGLCTTSMSATCAPTHYSMCLGHDCDHKLLFT